MKFYNMEQLVGVIGSIIDTKNTMIWGNSQSTITLNLNSDTETIEIGTSAQESTLTQLEFNKGVYPTKGSPPTGGGELLAFDGQLTIPIIDIEYVDLRCNFVAVSVIAHDVYHHFRQAPEPMTRDLFYCAYPPVLPKVNDTDPPNLPKSISNYLSLNDRYLSNVFSAAESYSSTEEFNNTPVYLSHKALKQTYVVGDKCSIGLNIRGTNFYSWYSLINNESSVIFDEKPTSCAYSCFTNQMVYHIKGGYSGETQLDGYVGTFNGYDFYDFQASDIAAYVKNHQIAFYYIDLGGY